MHVARNEMHYDACGFGRHDSWDRSGYVFFPSRPDNADHVKIYLDRQLILASMVRGECYLRVWCPLDGNHRTASLRDHFCATNLE